jgi:alkanesulfonate monooxygenase SsuD/methylene tetrahydromethanopterin reductase-like flavin-dependent oxidoreductase (luciferase family)
VGSGDLQDPGFGAASEPTEAKARAGRLDEALKIIDALWRGVPVTNQGTYFQLTELTMNPGPVQRPRIPIWMGGDWSLPRVRRRALWWDGCCVYKGSPEQAWQDMTTSDACEIRGAVARKRGEAAVFDICFGGRERQDD